MKHILKQSLSMLTACAMSFSMLSYLPKSIVSTAAASTEEDKTDLTINFDQSAISPEEALKDLYFDNIHTETYLEDNYDRIKWKPVYYWTCNNNPNDWSYENKRCTNLFKVAGISLDGRTDWKSNFKNYVSPYSLRTCLESTDEDYTYISLAADDDHDERNRDPWETINITSDKVLDLNGHTMNIRFDRNCNNDEINIKSEEYQNNNVPETHNAVAFNISNGATLTIVDSSAWRGEGTDGKGTGRINFTGYMIDPFKWAIYTYTTRDLFHVSNGNLVIYGGTFQAGRRKAQMPDNFSIDKLKTAIGTTVELGVSITEYATGLNTAVAKYEDIAERLNQPVDKSVIEAMKSSGNNNSSDVPSEVIVRDGKNGEVHEETKVGVPDKKPEDKQRNQTIGEKDAEQKKNDDNTSQGENKANEKGNAKEEKGKNEQLADAQNAIINKATEQSAIGSIVDKGFALGESIYNMLGKDLSKKVTQTIQGTVVTVGNRGSFVAYGGTFIGHGSTPNTRNAVIEVYNQPNAGSKKDDVTKNQGGVAYIYDGLFEAYSGANVFNMICENENQIAWQYTSNANGGHGEAKKIPLKVSETGGVEVLYYQNQNELTAKGGNATPIPINTANVQVRGGTFRCHYDLRNVAINPDNSEGNPRVSDEDKFRIFPGTSGSVNLGAESYNNKLIQDGRIQIEDPYGAGALVLMDERNSEKAGDEGLYYYRLFCSDTELRYKTYLRIYPNNDQQIRASRSMQLSTYQSSNDGSGSKTEKLTSKVFTSDPDPTKNDIDKDDIRAPYRQTEYYFDYAYDDIDAESYFVMPNFYNSKSDMMDVYGNGLGKNEIWYYPEPTNADLKALPDMGYSDYCVRYQDKGTREMVSYHAKDMQKEHDYLTSVFGNGDGWEDYVNKRTVSSGTVSYRLDEYDSIRRNLKYFTYKVYRVDPLTRENISESSKYGEDDPLITVHYGANTDSLKCKLPLKMVEREIKARRPDLNWQGYQDGEMYRIVLSVDEYLGYGFGHNVELPKASTETSILFRCYSDTEDTGNHHREASFTPLKWDYNASTHTISDSDYINTNGNSLIEMILAKLGYLSQYDAIASDRVAQISILNGKAGMVDYNASKVFDIYYQWWEVDENGDPIRLIAGTDNVYDSSMGEHRNHKPFHWNVGKDGQTYVNTVDPLDPMAKTYGTNGLPKDPKKWEDYQIHLYSNQTINRKLNGQDGLTVLHKESDKNLSLANNDVFATGTDKCYIPQDMAGKYLAVKVIALNITWPLAYDPKQTFWSKPVKVVDSHGELQTKAKAEYSDGKDYATYEHPATLSVDEIKPTGETLDQILNTKTLEDGEVISSVEYHILNGTASCKDVVYDNLKIIDTSKLPTAKYPDDFYNFTEESQKLRLRSNKISYRVVVKTTKANAPFRTSISNTEEFNYELEAKELLHWYNGSAEFKLSDIKNGKYPNGTRAYAFNPLGASAGLCDFEGGTSTAPEVAKLDANGMLIFGGGYGKTTITFKDLDNKDVSLDVTVINDYDKFKISGIKPPVLGEKLDYDSISIPDDAPYHITDVKWYKGYDEADKDDTVEYFKPYKVEITVESNEYCKAEDTSDYVIMAEQADGTVKTYNGSTYREYISTPEGLVPGQVYIISYTYDALTDHNATTIDKVYMDFPTEVHEGDNFLKWLEDVKIYTNGYNEGLKFTYTPLYGIDASYILTAYGYKMGGGNQLNWFTKGVQTGIDVKIEIPDDLEDLGDVFADKVTIYVNGEEKTLTTGKYNKTSISITEPDSLTILDGEAPPAAPAFTLDPNNSIDAVVGETISLKDHLYSDDPRVNVVLKSVNVDDQYENEYCDIDYDNGTVTPIKDYTHYPWNAMTIYYDVVFDADGDGYPEYQENHSYAFEKIYADRSEIPEKQTVPKEPYKVNITITAPDGKTISEDEYLYDKSTFALPTIEEDTFVLGIYDKDGKRVTLSSLKEDESYTVKTVSADSIEINSGKNTVYAFFKDQDGKNVDDLQISVDNSHFTTGDHIDGLKPDTAYTLYYKVGTNGQLYSKKFRTAKQEYGVYVGRIPVTDNNLGDLDQDGWNYDPKTNTLTLKDFELKDPGVRADVSELLGTKIWTRSTIYSPDDLNVKLIGGNSIDIQGDGLANSAIHSDKKLTIEGNGDLTVTEHGKGLGVYGLESKNDDIDLNGTGTLSFDEVSYAFNAENGSINYKNGTIDVKPEIREYPDESKTYTIGGHLVPEDQKAALKLSDAVHDLDISVSAEGESYETPEADAFDPSSSQFLRITPEHHDVEKVVSAGYHESGSCDTGSTYHFSCDCGHIGEESFSMPAEEHSLVKHDAKPATCDKSGTAEYWECELCGDIYADENGTETITAAELVIPALGHDLVHHEASEATCTEDGTGEHWACSRCGERFEDKNGLILLTDTVTPALGHEWIHYLEKYATCTKDGTIEHWKCANCGLCSADKNGNVLLTADELKVKASGHSWSEWTVTKEATETTEGEEARMCSNCGKTETKVIPVKAQTTTTTSTTTTTTSNKTTTTTSGKTTTTTSGKTTTTTSGKTTTTTSGKTTTTTSGKTTTTTSGKTTTTTSSVTTTTTSSATTTTTSDVYRNTLKFGSESPIKYTPKDESESAWSCIITADIEVESSKEFDNENAEDIEMIKNIKAYVRSALEEALNTVGDKEHLIEKTDMLSEEAIKIFNEGEGAANADCSITKLAIDDIHIVDGENPELEYTLGDVNDDGTVDGSDATWVLREFGYVLGGYGAKFTPEQFAAGDVDKNGVIDGSDATLILKFFGQAGKDIEISYGGMEPWMEKNFWNR